MSSSRCTRGMRTGDRSARRVCISSMASASRRKSSSARRLTANWATISPERIPWPERGAPLGDVGEERQGGEVALHDVLDPGALDLHDDPLAGAQPGDVGLADRRGGERLPVELGEHLVDRRRRARPRAPAWIASRGSGGTWFWSVGQRVGDVGGHQVDAGGGDLAELDVDAARFLEHRAQTDSRARRRRRPAARREPLAAEQPSSSR